MHLYSLNIMMNTTIINTSRIDCPFRNISPTGDFTYTVTQTYLFHRHDLSSTRTFCRHDFFQNGHFANMKFHRHGCFLYVTLSSEIPDIQSGAFHRNYLLRQDISPTLFRGHTCFTDTSFHQPGHYVDRIFHRHHILS